jgi:diaminopimelate decarboxylase
VGDICAGMFAAYGILAALRARDRGAAGGQWIDAAMLDGLFADRSEMLILEPGRSLVGNAGILVSRVLYTKQSGDKRFLIQDAAMNDLIRPALYESFHRIWPVASPAGLPAPPDDFEAAIADTEPWDVVGPVCESGDFLAKDRPLPRLDRGDLLAVFSAGAYGMAMASNYNTRPRAAEVLVARNQPRLVRRRETYEDLVSQERGIG